jgi:anti-anti-sigma factor
MLTSSIIEKFPDGKAEIIVAGSLTFGSSLKLLDSQIRNLVAGEVSDLLMDLTKVEYVDSAGLGLLVHTYGLLNAKQGTLRVTGVNPFVMDLLRLTKLDSLLAIEGRGEGSPLSAG